MPPLFLRIHERDNVAIIVAPEGVKTGTATPAGFSFREDIQQARKVALRDVAAGEDIVRYGHVIGYANHPIAAGTWVRQEMLRLPEPPSLDDLPLATAPPPPQPPLEGVTFEGFRNPDGSAGTKNILGIVTTVQCTAPTVEYAARRIKQEILPRFANVDDVVAITHGYGCGIAMNSPGADVPLRTLRHIGMHANLGGSPLVVGLGCEKVQPDVLFTEAALRVLGNSERVRLQDYSGFAESVSVIMEAAEKRLEELDGRRRETVPASQLVVGLQCGGSDAFSGVTCNPAVGFAADLLVRAGATVLFSEVSEVRDAIHLLTPRAINKDVARALVREMRWYDEYLAQHGADRSANPTPGNLRGGIANVVEKALGSIAKAGSTAIMGVATHGERAATKGLVFAATPASDFICGTQQLASMNLHIFTTGEGSPYGLAMVPVVKVSSRTALAERWHDLIDIDAGRIATGSATVEDVGWESFRFVLDVASGRKQTWAERWGLHNDLVLFNPGAIT